MANYLFNSIGECAVAGADERLTYRQAVAVIAGASALAWVVLTGTIWAAPF